MQLIHYVKHGNAGDKNPSSLVIKSKQDQQKKKRKNSVKTRYKTAGNDTSHTRSGTDHRSTRRSRWRRWWVVGFCCSDEKKPDRLIDCSIISTLFLFWLSVCVCVCVCVCGGSFWLFVSFLLDVYLKRKTRFLERVPDGVFLLFVVAFGFLRVCVCVCVWMKMDPGTHGHQNGYRVMFYERPHRISSGRRYPGPASSFLSFSLSFFLSFLFSSCFSCSSSLSCSSTCSSSSSSFFLLLLVLLVLHLLLLLVLHHHHPLPPPPSSSPSSSCSTCSSSSFSSTCSSSSSSSSSFFFFFLLILLSLLLFLLLFLCFFFFRFSETTKNSPTRATRPVAKK